MPLVKSNDYNQTHNRLMKLRTCLLLLSFALSTSVIYAENEHSLRDTLLLSHRSQLIDGAELTKVKDANFLNSLIGRMAGATINPSASGVGGSVRFVMRGYRSILRSNNALFTLDGIPLPRLEFGQSYDEYFGAGQTGDGMAAFDSEDIESISILSSAAASVLYGSRSANGVVMINTKKAHSEKLRIELGNSTTFSSSFVMPKFQDTYGRDWGEKLAVPESWNPADFFRTGHSINNSLSLSFGNDYNQTRISAVTMNGTGLIPNNNVDRYNFSLRNTSSLLRHRLKLDVSLRYIHTTEQNMLSQGMYCNPLVPVYLIPDVLQKHLLYEGGPMEYTYKDYYERYDPDLGVNTQYWPLGERVLGMQNPYWIINRNMFNQKKERWLGGIGAKFDLTSWLDVSGRIHFDRDKEIKSQKYYASTISALAGPLGSYGMSDSKHTQLYTDLLLNARKAIGNFSIHATLGTSMCDTKLDYYQKSRQLEEINVFDLSQSRHFFSREEDYHDRTTSLFMLAQLGYKNRLFLDLGARKEWFKFWDGDRSSFSTDVAYPSMGVSVVPTAWLSDNPGRFLSFLKLNYTYSETVNNMADYASLIKNRMATLQPDFIENNLKNERTKIQEVGINADFLDNKVSFAYTMYKASTSGLVFEEYVYVPFVDANICVMHRGCQINNTGFDLTLATNLHLGQVRWNGRLTYSIAKNEIKQLMEPEENPVTGEMFELDEVRMAKGRGWYTSLKKGGSIGDIYVTDLKRDDKGEIMLDKVSQNVTFADEYVYAGNSDPKYTMGLANSFSWKGLEFNFVIHARFGGVGLSHTQAVMDQFGMSKATAIARDNGGVWVNGQQIPAKNYYLEVGRSRVGSVYTYDATNIRLAEMSIAYHIPVRRWVNWIQDVRVALVGRNLLMLYNKAPFDPESTASTGTWYQGIDSFRQPSSRNMGFSVNLTF